MRYRGGGSAPLQAPSACSVNGSVHTHKKKGKKTGNTRKHDTHLSRSRVSGPAALFMTTLDDMAPEEQVVHNVIPLKDKMPPLGFSDVPCKAKSSPDSDICQVSVRRFTY